ncbi:MAG: DUF370 domain-containing protein [Oscillospiraceae bacterium]|jgi:regulator of extracellular matrix RemA (YlzA/DUF370 family)|nr:DUF370 domain-containing protein [Oscillospiraceae bacterium]
MQLISIGFGSIIVASRVIAMVTPDTAPIKRLITESRERGLLIDATYGRRTRSVIIADSGHVVLSAILPKALIGRLKNAPEDLDDE